MVRLLDLLSKFILSIFPLNADDFLFTQTPHYSVELRLFTTPSPYWSAHRRVFQIFIFHHKSDLGQQLSRILDIKASRGVIPICFKGTINLPISRPRRREAQKDY